LDFTANLPSLHGNSPNCAQVASKFLAQIFNLLTLKKELDVCRINVCGLQSRDTAECNSALLGYGSTAPAEDIPGKLHFHRCH